VSTVPPPPTCYRSPRTALPSGVSTWIAQNATAFDRCVQMLTEVTASGASDLATLSVAVREIRNLIEATAAPARDARKPVEQPGAPVRG
jgi:hypothetical protein